MGIIPAPRLAQRAPVQGVSTLFEVVTCGFTPASLRAHPWSGRIHTVPWPGDPAFLDTAYDDLKARADHPVVLLHDGGRSSRRRVAALRALLRSPQLLTMGIDAPLTGLAGCAAWLSSLGAASVPAGLAAGYLIERHRELLPTYAVVTSVAGLDLPQVRLAHHVISWVPGTTFFVELDAETHVAAGSLDVRLPKADALDLVVCGNPRYAARLHAATPAQVGETFEVDVPQDGPQWWGRARFFEHTLVPRAVHEDVSRIGSNSASRCAVCGESAYGPCPFCKMRDGIAA